MSSETVDVVIIAIPNQTKSIRPSSKDGNDYVSLHELLPGDFPHTRIIPYVLNSVTPLANLHDHATEMLDHLSNLRKIDPYRPILFIAHKVGGLVVKVALVRAWRESKYRPIAGSTRAIAFLGTQHRITSFSKSILPLESCHGGRPDLAPARGSHNLASQWTQSSQSSSNLSLSLNKLHDSWTKVYATRLRITTVYGTVSPVVPESCAVCNIPGEVVIPLNTTYELLGYFTSRNDLLYRAIKDKVSWMLGWIDESVPSRRDFGDDEYQILSSLWPEELVSSVHLIPEPHKKTFSWIWPTVSMQSWLESAGTSFYWITGKPGSGKSMMLKYIWDKLSDIESDVPLSAQGSRDFPILVAAHFTDFNFPASSSGSILRSLLHQVVAVQPSLSKFLTSSLPTWHYHDERHLRDLSFALHHLARHSNIVIVIDGLDECHSDVWRDTLEALYLDDTHISPEDLVPPDIDPFCSCINFTGKRHKRGLKVMLSSRSQIFEDLSMRDARFCLDLSIGKPVQGLIHDARHIVADRLQLRWDIYHGVLTPIFDQLATTDRATGIYLWVSLVASSLFNDIHYPRSVPRRGMTTHNTFNAPLPSHAASEDPTSYLTVVPTSLDELYQFVLEAVLRRNNRALVLKVLTWVCLAQTPLSPIELWEAIGTKSQGSRQSEEVSRVQGQNPRMFMLGGLVEVRDSKVRLIHQTARDFLLDKLPLLWPLRPAPVSQLVGEHPDYKSLLHDELYLRCVEYLHTISHVENVNIHMESYKLDQRWPLLQYAAKNWRQHQVKAHVVAPDDLTRKLFRPRSLVFIAWFRRWWNHECHNKEDLQIFPTSPTQGIVASFLGHEALVQEWLELVSMRATEHTKYGIIWTPLMAASWSGHISIVSLLLDRPETEHERPERKAKALVYAIRRGHPTVVQSLARAFAVPTAGPSMLKEVYLAAVQKVDYDLIAQLLEANANDEADGRGLKLFQQLRDIPSKPDTNAHQVLRTAVQVGSSDITRLLLQTGGLRDRRRVFTGPTALHIAAINHRTSIARLLLLLGASDVCAADELGLTPLHLAATYGHLSMVTLLLDHGARIDVIDRSKRTALELASRHGRADMVKLLLERGAIPNVRTSPSVTSGIDRLAHRLTGIFIDSCQSASSETVRNFLQMGVSANCARGGIPALHHALIDGSLPIATGMRRPPHEGSRIEVLRLLLDAGVSPDVTDPMLQTCLHRAAQRSEGLISRFLVSVGANINLHDQHGRTPLDYASRNADMDVIEHLIQAGSIVSNTTWLSVLESGNSSAALQLLIAIGKLHTIEDTVRQRSPSNFDLQPHPTQVFQYFIQSDRVPERFSGAMSFLIHLGVRSLQHVRVENNRSSSWWDSFTRRWETMTKTRWIWWPLPKPSPLLRRDECYVYWGCPGGTDREHCAVISSELGLEIQSVVDFQRELSMAWSGTESTGHSEQSPTDTNLMDAQPLLDVASGPTSASPSSSLALIVTTEPIFANTLGNSQNGAGTFELAEFRSEVDEAFDSHTSDMPADGIQPPGAQDPSTDGASHPNDSCTDQGDSTSD
ncbi:Pfs NACHT and Ankyrin domain protein [Apiospora arundinis]|uniref:Pfs NACHT and Ankyrin domain protein n=1 Tax=Apiospora arundinis TaxID=335852 RepID=A0ABR2IV79_9PEZI